jgi:hypothetical protein
LVAVPTLGRLLVVCETERTLALAARAFADVPDQMTTSSVEDAVLRLELGLVSVALVVSCDWAAVAARTSDRQAYRIAGCATEPDGPWMLDALEGGADACLASTDPRELRALLTCALTLGFLSCVTPL